MSRPAAQPRPLCPSAQAEWPGSVAIGVVGGSADEPRVRPLASAQAVTIELLQLAAPARPTEVFRFAAPCLCQGCLHFEADTCHLAERIVAMLPVVSADLPECAVRPRCRWWLQEGAAACQRCPQVVTENHNPSDLMLVASTPTAG